MNTPIRLKKNEFMIFLDIAKDTTFASNTWKRIDKSTIFALTVGEQTEDVDYIVNANPTTEITGNKPTLPEEITLEQGNPIFDFMLDELQDLPVGADCYVPALLCFGGSTARAWRTIATITDKVLDTVAGKITFTINFGDVMQGTFTVTAGVPTFTPTSASSLISDLDGE